MRWQKCESGIYGHVSVFGCLRHESWNMIDFVHLNRFRCVLNSLNFFAREFFNSLSAYCWKMEMGNAANSTFSSKLFALIDSEWPLIGPNYSITLLTMRFFVQTRSTNAFFLNIRAMKHGQRPLSNSKPKRNCARVVCPVRSALNLRQFAIFPLFAHEIKNQSENINDKMKNELVSGC